MQFSNRFRTGVYALLSVSLVIAGCNTMPSSVKSGSPIVSSSGTTGKNNPDNDPLLAHLRARRMVDPSDTSTVHKYTKKAPSKSILGPDLAHVTKQKPADQVELAENNYQENAAQEAPNDTQFSPQPAIPQDKIVQQSKAVETAPVQQNAGSAVTNVRVGEHPGKTRLVLDVTDTPDFNYSLENDKNLLLINLPQAAWEAELKRVFANHPLMLAYIAKPAPEGGTVLALKLRRPVRVLFNAAFKPSGPSGHRIVFDIASA